MSHAGWAPLGCPSPPCTPASLSAAQFQPCLHSRAGQTDSSVPFPPQCPALLCSLRSAAFSEHIQVPTASKDRGSHTDSIKVQWCHKTQELGLSSRILNKKPLPAALHPLGPHARPAVHCSAPPSQEKAAGSEITAEPPAVPSRLGDTRGHIPCPASPGGCPVCHMYCVCTCCTLGQDQPEGLF